MISLCQGQGRASLAWVEQWPERPTRRPADARGEVKTMLGAMSTSMRRPGGPKRAARVKALVNMPPIVDTNPERTVHA